MRDVVGRAMQRHRRRERNRRDAAGRRSPLDVAVGGVEHVGPRDPLRTERKHVLTFGERRVVVRHAAPGSRRVGARGRVRHFGPELSIFDELNTPYIAEISATATNPTINPMKMMTAGSNSDVSFFSLYSSSRP